MTARDIIQKLKVKMYEVAPGDRKQFFLLLQFDLKASSSIGRASVSKTEGWGFNSSLAC